MGTRHLRQVMTCLIVMPAFALAIRPLALRAAALPATPPATQAGEPGVRVQYTANGSIKAVISKETTYLTEPVLPDGTIDYLKAINDKASAGVTKENNAAVVLFEVFGPKVVDEKIRAEFFKRLDMNLPEAGDYFLSLEDFVKSQMPGKTDGEIKKAQEAVTAARDAATEKPWSADQYPVLAQWIKGSARPVDRMMQASQRPRYYTPLLTSNGPAQVIGAVIPGLAEIRIAVNALRCRATMRLQAGDKQGAWSDVLAILRWSRLIRQQPALICDLLGLACEQAGNMSVASIAVYGDLTAEESKRLLIEVDSLPPARTLADTLMTERYTHLDAGATLQRGQTLGELLTQLGIDHQLEGTRPLVDYTAVMRQLNRQWDEIEKVWSVAAPMERLKAGMEVDRRIQQIKDRVGAAGDRGPWRRLLALSADEQRKTATAYLPDYLTALLTPAHWGGGIRFEARVQARVDVTRLALALAAYHAEHKEYPADLAALAPDYVKEIPKDLFNDQPLHYQRTGAGQRAGYLLYSVGANMKDEGGGEKGDDIVVRKS